MADSAFVVFVTKGFLAAKGALQEIDLRLRVRHHQVGRDRVVAVWNWFDCHDFCPPQKSPLPVSSILHTDRAVFCLRSRICHATARPVQSDRKSTRLNSS